MKKLQWKRHQPCHKYLQKTQPPKATQRKILQKNDPALPPSFRNDGHREPFLRSQGWGWFTSAVTHYGSSGEGPGLGENRVKLLTCGILSYYSPKFENQAISRAVLESETLNLTSEGFWAGVLDDEDSRATALNALMRRRRSHTLNDVSTDEAAIMKEDSERVLENLRGQSVNCSGIDWTAMTNEIVRKYASPLVELLHSLQNYSSIPPLTIPRKENGYHPSETRLIPSFSPSWNIHPEENPLIWTRQSPSSKPPILTATTITPESSLPSTYPSLPKKEPSNPPSKKTQGQICNIIIDIGFSTENIWNSSFNQRPTNRHNNPTSPLEKNTKELTRWVHGIEELMAWLGWAGEWTSCEGKCGVGERCYMPMWPMLGGEGPIRRPPPRHGYGPGKEHGPGYGYEPGYGYDGPLGRGDHKPPAGDHPGRPGWGIDETDLWQPSCVGLDYIMGADYVWE
ncbi:hypothetical protein DID88_004381 [Monilinia fructigena]|uniref:Uncharacterized protein n=1 Tax=Monilinia fructigena TaxID=38457 RepID=A0A395ISM8_9HELO|nr:hypothetical protein DID88_004381 [Monilinia fructigena]